MRLVWWCSFSLSCSNFVLSGLIACIRIFLALSHGIILLSRLREHCVSSSWGWKRVKKKSWAWSFLGSVLGLVICGIMCGFLCLWYMRNQIHCLNRDQGKPEGLCPVADMEQVPATGRLVQITVADGYDVVTLLWVVFKAPGLEASVGGMGYQLPSSVSCCWPTISHITVCLKYLEIWVPSVTSEEEDLVFLDSNSSYVIFFSPFLLRRMWITSFSCG